MNTRIVARLLTGALAALLLAGCAADSDGPAIADGSPSQTPSTSAATDRPPAREDLPSYPFSGLLLDDLAYPSLELVLDPYLPSMNERILIEQAADLLVRTCMAEAGVDDYPVRDFTALIDEPRYAGAFGLIDPAEAKEHGYRLAADVAREQVRERRAEALASFDAAVIKRALGGEPWPADLPVFGQEAATPAAKGQGCQPESRRQLAEAADATGQPGARAVAETRRLITVMEGHRQREEATTDLAMMWRQCMRTGGAEEHRNPAEAEQAARDLGPREQRNLAALDIGCRMEAGYLTSWPQAVADGQKAHLTENRKALERANLERFRLNRVAQAIVSAELVAPA